MNQSIIYSEKRAKKETLLYEAALDVFSELGFREAGIEDIAKRAGVANGTVYLYATSKRDLYRRVVEYGLNAWQAAAVSAAESVSLGSVEEDDPFEMVNRRSVELIEQAIVSGIESGEFTVSDPTAAAELLFSLYRMLIEMAYVLEDGKEHRQFEAGLSIILNGITAR